MFFFCQIYIFTFSKNSFHKKVAYINDTYHPKRVWKDLFSPARNLKILICYFFFKTNNRYVIFFSSLDIIYNGSAFNIYAEVIFFQWDCFTKIDQNEVLLMPLSYLWKTIDNSSQLEVINICIYLPLPRKNRDEIFFSKIENKYA